MSKASDTLNFENDVGTSSKMPKFLKTSDYDNWKVRFHSYIMYTDPDLWVPISTRYVHPIIEGNYEGPRMMKTYDQMSVDEKKLHDRECKARAAITMCLPKEIFNSFKTQKLSYDLWTAMEKRFEGNLQMRKSKKSLLRKQFDTFTRNANESVDDLITRFSQIVCDLKELGTEFEEFDVNEKLIEALPESWDTQVLQKFT